MRVYQSSLTGINRLEGSEPQGSEIQVRWRREGIAIFFNLLISWKRVNLKKMRSKYDGCMREQPSSLTRC